MQRRKKKDLNDNSAELSDYEEEYSGDWGEYISSDIEADSNLCPEDSESGITGQASGVCTIINRNYNSADYAKAKSEDNFASRQKIYGYIDKYGRQYNINFNLVRSIIQTESEWNENEKASSGAYGLMQLKPSSSVEDLKKGTCSKLYGPTSINPYDTEQNIKGGIMYLNCMIKLFKGNFPLALASYRMGPTAIAKNCKKDLDSCPLWWSGRPMAMSYVGRVKQAYEGFVLSNNPDGPIIAIDPGHGGGDSGAIGINGLKEEDINLEIALKLRDILQNQGFRVIMTRDTDVYVSLSERAKIANNAKAVYFISIHANSAEECTNAEGTETYYFSNKGKQLADIVQENIVGALGTKDRGTKKGDFQVIRETDMPGILVETGFICNENDAAKLNQDSDQQQVASAISQSVKALV